MSARNAYPVAIASVANFVCALILERWKTNHKTAKVVAAGSAMAAVQLFAIIIASTRQANNANRTVVIVAAHVAAVGFVWPFLSRAKKNKKSAKHNQDSFSKVRLLAGDAAADGF